MRQNNNMILDAQLTNLSHLIQLYNINIIKWNINYIQIYCVDYILGLFENYRTPDIVTTLPPQLTSTAMLRTLFNDSSDLIVTIFELAT